MNLEKFGRAGLFVLFMIVFLAGVKMAGKVVNPYIRKVSPSLADALAP